MPSIFEHVTKKMVKKLGGKDLRPVKSLLDATHFRQFSILRKKSRFWIWEQPDLPVEYSLMDIPASVPAVPEAVVTGPFFFSDTVIQKQKGDVGVNAGVDVSMSGEVTQMHKSTLEMQKVTIPSPNLEGLQNSKLLDPEPSFLKYCRETGDNLYVVTEVVELTNTIELLDNSSVNASGKFSGSWNTLIKGEAGAQSLKARETTLTIPQGTVMAYKRKQLVIKDNGVTILLISTDAKQKTFQDALLQPQGFSSERTIFKSRLRVIPILPEGRTEERFWRDFKNLQQEVFWKTKELARLPKDVRGVVFCNILPMLRDRGALQDLMDMLELESLGHLDGPGSVILNKLLQDPRLQWDKPQGGILCLLQAMMVLSDTQLHLLAQSMEKGILLQQRELVRSILEPNFRYPWSIPFTLPPEHLAPLQAEGVAITYGLLEECGLKMEPDSPRSTWDLEAKMPLSALYGTLSLLQQLAEP
ncbi:gasdermin-C [Sciurus carolinensis]|uniref:gasdermin-C n=1 Tax=Sciurus carolinensis TaxID=30640 RepID=UPI001FB48EBF|nr:gasdermin-C [Sciurus carolinensis]XP_047418305.1 gasdermin-C [Sciurus carolinensis]XP_047418312.1 gasdermin-C [Sciurus carolinensis]